MVVVAAVVVEVVVVEVVVYEVVVVLRGKQVVRTNHG